jgi:hypothetical protein
MRLRQSINKGSALKSAIKQIMANDVKQNIEIVSPYSSSLDKAQNMRTSQICLTYAIELYL